MLVLTRKFGEKIIVNGNIEITYLGHKKGNVLIGIKAPQEVTIMREELLNVEESIGFAEGQAPLSSIRRTTETD